MKFLEPANFLDERFTVRSYESGVTNHVSLATLCNYMQESAGLSADKLGWGICKLQDEGLTWMLSRLYVKVSMGRGAYAAHMAKRHERAASCNTMLSGGG